MIEKTNKFKKLGQKNQTTIVLTLLLVVFLTYSLFVATHLQRGIIPDEPAHFLFSKHFASTWGIPPDTYETFSRGWYIEQNHFLYHWLNGRIINIIFLITPSITDWQLLIILRMINSFYALGSAIFVYMMSSEVIKYKWWRLFPVFLLTNTLMFVFLSGGVNYDNLAVLLSTIGLYFLVKVFTRRDFLTNSLSWMISISIGTLVKYTLLPLALGMSIVWAIFFFNNRKLLLPIKFNTTKVIILLVVFLALALANFSIYGVNLIKHQSILSPCKAILSEDQCQISPYVQRYNKFGLDEKLSLIESIRLGYPNPVEYLIKSWIPLMLTRIYGILGHKVYYPLHTIFWFELLFYWMVLLLFKYWRRPSNMVLSFLGIIVFYALTVFLISYDSELLFGFKNFLIQGRYIFPVISIAYVLLTLLTLQIPNRILRRISLAYIMILFFIAGPVTFILKYNSQFSGWFLIK